MSTIDKASLIQIPSGYKNGKLYSVKPNPTYGSELITNGDFATDSDWSLSPNAGTATISNGKLNFTNSSSSGSQVQQTSRNYVIGKTYKVTLTVSDYVQGNVRLSVGNNITNYFDSNGTFTQYLTYENGLPRTYVYTDNSTLSIDNVSVKEVLNDGDFDFSRSSSATRVNSAGLIEVAQVVSTTEEVTNGDFATDSDWTKGSGWTISGGTANQDNSTPNSGDLTQSNVTTSGKKYKVTFDLVVTSGTISVLVGGHNLFTSSGTKTFIKTATSSNLTFRNYSNFIGSIDNVSVKEVIENDVPRLDYSGGASCASLLLEPQSTNLITKSVNWDNWSEIRTTLSFEQETSPSGNQDASLLVDSTDNNTHISQAIYYTSLGTSDVTWSLFAKKQNNRYISLRLQDDAANVSGNTNYIIANYDLENGTVTDTLEIGTPTNAYADIQQYGNGWYRLIISMNKKSGITRTDLQIRLCKDGIAKTVEAFAGTGNDGNYFYGFQLEELSYPTSYIPTSGSTVTRTADVCNNAGTSATFNDSEGVLFAEIAALSDDLTYRQISLTESSGGGDVLTLDYSSTSNQIRSYIRVNGTTQSLTHTLTDETQYNKIAIKYKDTHEIWVNGSKVASSSLTLLPIDINLLTFDNGAGNGDFYGNTKQLMVFNEALSDEELSDLTGQVNDSFVQLANFYNYTIL